MLPIQEDDAAIASHKSGAPAVPERLVTRGSPIAAPSRVEQ
jgi:hypothetical protein